MEKAPIDVAVSLSGRMIYALTDEGMIYILSVDGRQRDKVFVGKSIDGIKADPRDGVLFISSRKNMTIQVITLDSVQNINVSAYPSKGSATAPVLIAVFSDFQ
ncbi:MAG: hypothetical protein QGG48_00370 [Desulfatiglandales bacterium]|jgi:hypothetical protein|nr:hypothetical protein [Desulfatiglandales bacterium]